MKRKISKHPTKPRFLSCPSVPESGLVAIVFDVVGVDGNRDDLNDGNDCKIC